MKYKSQITFTDPRVTYSLGVGKFFELHLPTLIKQDRRLKLKSGADLNDDACKGPDGGQRILHPHDGLPLLTETLVFAFVVHKILQCLSCSVCQKSVVHFNKIPILNGQNT